MKQANRPTLIGRNHVSIFVIPRTCRPSQSIYRSASPSTPHVVSLPSELHHQHEFMQRTTTLESSAGRFTHHSAFGPQQSHQQDQQDQHVNPKPSLTPLLPPNRRVKPIPYRSTAWTGWPPADALQHATCNMPCHARPKKKVTVRCTYMYRAVIPLVSHQPLYFPLSSKFLHLRWIIITRSHALPRFLHYCTFLASESSESIPRGYLSACPEGFRNPFVNAVCSPLAVVCGLVSPELPKSPVI